MNARFTAVKNGLCAALKGLQWFRIAASGIAAALLLTWLWLLLEDAISLGDKRLVTLVGTEGISQTKRMLVQGILGAAILHIIAVTLFIDWIKHTRRIKPRNTRNDASGKVHRAD